MKVSTNFIQVLEQGQSISQAGNWGGRIYCLLFGYSSYYQRLTALFVEQMDLFERTPLEFNAENQEQKEKIARFFKGAQLLQNRLSDQDPLWHRLAQRVEALRYRAEGVNGGADKTEGLQISGDLKQHLSEWKRTRTFYADAQKPLTARDEKVLREICRYESFASLLLKNPSLREGLFDWAIKDNNQVSLFVEFPSIAGRLTSLALAKRVGRFGGKILEMVKEEQKLVTMRFEGRSVSILDESQVLSFKGGGKWSIREIFDEHFGKKDEKIGDFEVFGDSGVSCWNAHELGYYSPAIQDYVRADLEKEEWWKELPVFEVIEAEELERRTGLAIKEKRPWAVATAKATREYPCLDLDRCHGFMGAALLQPDGRYQVFDFGKYPIKYPVTFVEKAFFVAATVLAKVEYPDTNNFYSERQTAVHAKEANEAQGRELMRAIAEDLKKARAGRLVFQFGGDNCAFWLHDLFSKIFGQTDNLYRMPLFQTELSNTALKTLIGIGVVLPKQLSLLWMTFLMQALGYKKGIMIDGELKSLHTTSIAREGHEFFCPSYLHKRIKEEGLAGILFGGH